MRGIRRAGSGDGDGDLAPGVLFDTGHEGGMTMARASEGMRGRSNGREGCMVARA